MRLHEKEFSELTPVYVIYTHGQKWMTEDPGKSTL